MLLSLRNIAKAAYAVQQQALVQLGSTAGSTWENLTSTQQEAVYELAQEILAGNQASGITFLAGAPYAFNSHQGGAGATVTTPTAFAAAVPIAAGYLTLAASTLTGTMEAGDTITVTSGGVAQAFTVLSPATAAGNAITVYVGANQPRSALAAGATWTYTAAGATPAKAQYVFNEAVLALSGLMGG